MDGITKNLLNGKWWPHTDWKFYRVPPEEGQHSVGEAKRAQDFLLILNDCIRPHLLMRERRVPHYEDLFSAALQIVQDETAESTSPLISGSLSWMKAATTHLYVGQEPHIDDNRFASLAERASDLIQWVVYHSLIKTSSPSGLSVLSDVAKAVDEMDTFSLNHDLLIEAQLNREGVHFKDGFGTVDGEARLFNGSWRQTDSKVRLLKLHGSLNWYLFRFKDRDQYAVVNSDPDYCNDAAGNPLDPLDVKPMFLTGTGVKEQAYGTGLFGDIFSEFRRLLATHRTLICCGYGWGDKGINTRLRQWLRDAKTNRIVILHNGPVDELRRKRFWYWHWEDFARAGKVVVVPKWLSECSLADVQPYFDE